MFQMSTVELHWDGTSGRGGGSMIRRSGRGDSLSLVVLGWGRFGPQGTAELIMPETFFSFMVEQEQGIATVLWQAEAGNDPEHHVMHGTAP